MSFLIFLVGIDRSTVGIAPHHLIITYV